MYPPFWQEFFGIMGIFALVLVTLYFTRHSTDHPALHRSNVRDIILLTRAHDDAARWLDCHPYSRNIDPQFITKEREH